MSSTRWAIIEEAIQFYGLGRYGLNDATQSGLTTLSDSTRFAGHLAKEGVEVGAEVRVHQNSTAAQAGTDSYGGSKISIPPSYSAGQLTVSPAFTAAALPETPVVANNYTEFHVLFPPFRFEDLWNGLNHVLENFPAFEKRLVPITLATDGDMMSSGTSDWTTSSATILKSAATFPQGFRALRVTATGTPGYATPVSTQALHVEEGQSYYLEATGRIAYTGGTSSHSGTLRLFDNAASGYVTLSNTVIDRFEPEILINNVTMAAGAEQMGIVLQSDTSGNVIEWSAVIFRKNDVTDFILADRPQQIERIGRVFASRSDTWAQRGWDLMHNEIPAEAVQEDAGLWRLMLGESVAGLSVWYEEFIKPAVMTADSDTTYLPKEALASMMAEYVLAPYQNTKKWGPHYIRAARQAAFYMRKYVEDNRVVRHQTQRRVSLPRV